MKQHQSEYCPKTPDLVVATKDVATMGLALEIYIAFQRADKLVMLECGAVDGGLKEGRLITKSAYFTQRYPSQVLPLPAWAMVSAKAFQDVVDKYRLKVSYPQDCAVSKD